MLSIDTQLVLDAQRLMMSTPWSNALAVFFARWSIFLNLGFIFFLVFSRKKTSRHAAYEAMWSIGIAFLLVALIASVVQRPRPFVFAETGIASFIPPPTSTAFPSGHTSAAVAIAAALFRANPWIGFASTLVAALTAFGRIAAGVHYPTDILAGICVGLASFGIIRWIHRQLARRDITRSAARHSHE